MMPTVAAAGVALRSRPSELRAIRRLPAESGRGNGPGAGSGANSESSVASGRKKTWAEHWKLHNALVLFNPAPVT